MPSNKLYPAGRLVVDDRIFFAGMVILILGLLVLVYDIPQIMYMHTMTVDELQLLDRADLEKFDRVQAEIYVGIGILVAGAVTMLFSKFPPGALVKK